MELENKWSYKEYTNREKQICHNAYEVELYFYQAIRDGDVKYIKAVSSQEQFETLPGIGTLSSSLFKNVQYHYVISVALAARACIEGGLPVELAFSLSDFYIQQLDSCQNATAIDKLTYQMNIDFTQRMHELKQKHSYSKPITKCIDYIYSHLHVKILVSDLADYVNFNKSHLSRVFKAETGCTIQEYIMRERINEAKNLLTFSKLTCNEIAYELAFSSQSHFTNIFKQHTNMTPHTYKRMYYGKIK